MSTSDCRITDKRVDIAYFSESLSASSSAVQCSVACGNTCVLGQWVVFLLPDKNKNKISCSAAKPSDLKKWLHILI